ncbi:MAG: T9SS type A sorting domain-containing protein [Ferruginibacter sp.]
MERVIFFLLLLLAGSITCIGQTRYWVGGAGGTWSTAANWSLTSGGGGGAGAPTSVQDAIINTNATINIDVAVGVNSITITNNSSVIFQTAVTRNIAPTSTSLANPAFRLDAGSTLTMDCTNAAGTNNLLLDLSNGIGVVGQINGTLIFSGTGGSASSNARFSTFSGALSFGNVTVSNTGYIKFFPNSGNATTSATSFTMQNGATYEISKDGGSFPNGVWQTTSLALVTGSGANGPSFLGTTYGNFQINKPSLTVAMAINVNINFNDVNLISTGSDAIRAKGGTGATTYILTINGNLNVSSSSKLETSGNTTTSGNPGIIIVKGNVINDGIIRENGAAIGNQFILQGASNQDISGSGSYTGDDLNFIINNGSGATLTSPVTISCKLTFTSGVLSTTAAKLLTMAAGSSVFGASNASFVDGPLAKIGNTAFTFPVGKPNCGPSGTVKGYAALAISNFTGGLITDQFTAEYKRGDALALGAGTISNTFIKHVSRCDYWTLTRDGATASTVDITLSWDAPINNCVTTAPYVDNLASLTIAHNNNTVSSTWDTYAVAGVACCSNTTGNVTWDIGSPQSTTFGAFALASLDIRNPLPITINYLNGTKQNSNHLLNWKVTCNSTASATMSLERSNDDRNYSGIYTITATALRCQQPFDYADDQPLAGVNYYRLKITDANGKVSYSSVISLINADKGFDIMSISPNPIVNGNFKLNVSTAQKMQMDIVITDIQGRLMQRQTVNMIAGFNTIPINVTNLAAGTYQVYTNTPDGRSRVLRFVKQ